MREVNSSESLTQSLDKLYKSKSLGCWCVEL